MTTRCPPWCDADHTREPTPVRHRGAAVAVPVLVEGRGHGGPHPAELLVEVSRQGDEAAVWVYLGDGWTGFSLAQESARRLATAFGDAARTAGTLEG